jgi:hypothetical protein
MYLPDPHATQSPPQRPSARSHTTPLFADTLLALERSHLTALGFWAAASLLAGSAVLAALAVRRARWHLVGSFATVTAVWGGAELIAVAAAWNALALRDLAGATRLDRFLWLETGLDLGIVAIGMTLAFTAWRLARRLDGVGAGIGTAVQGAALLALHIRLALRLSGLV